jgi:hypothetical protein
VRSLRLVATIAAGVTLMFAINVATAGAQVAFTWSGPGFIPAPGPCSSADIAISGQFVISSMTCPQTGFVGENGASCAINVRFKPQSKGKKKGFLRISSNPFGGVPLAGKGCKKENGKLDCKK